MCSQTSPRACTASAPSPPAIANDRTSSITATWSGKYREANNYTAQINAIYGPGTQLLGYLGQATLLGIGGDMVIHKTLSAGALIAFFLYLNRFFSPIQLLVQQYNTFQQGQSSIQKLQTLFDVEPSVPEDPEATELPPIQGEIVFDHVTFGYDPATPVIMDVNLRIAERRDRCVRRPDRGRQVHDGEVGHPLLRSRQKDASS